jgi:hypothetical protein
MHAVVAIAAKIACPEESTVESGELFLWPVHKSLFPSAKCNLHQRGRRAIPVEFPVPQRSLPAGARGESCGHRPFLGRQVRTKNQLLL